MIPKISDLVFDKNLAYINIFYENIGKHTLTLKGLGFYEEEEIGEQRIACVHYENGSILILNLSGITSIYAVSKEEDAEYEARTCNDCPKNFTGINGSFCKRFGHKITDEDSKCKEAF
jgi:hypothetical protein